MVYHPSLGRFMQADPEKFIDGPNMYQFAQSNPVNRGDPMGLEAQPPKQFINSDDVNLNGTVSVHVVFGTTTKDFFSIPLLSITITYKIKDNYITNMSVEPQALNVPIPFMGTSVDYDPGTPDTKAYGNSLKMKFKAQTSFQFKDEKGNAIDNRLMKAFVTADYAGSIATKDPCNGIKGDLVFSISGNARVQTQENDKWSDPFAVKEERSIKKPFTAGKFDKNAVSIGKILARGGETVPLGGELGSIRVLDKLADGITNSGITWSLELTGDKMKNP